MRPPSDPTKYAVLQQPLSKSLLNAASKSLVIGSVVAVAGTALKMRNKDLIEWQDRSWRLLVNNGQNMADKWSVGGLLIGGAVGTVVSRQYKISLPKAIAGSAALGGLVGLTCMAIYRKL